MHDTRRWYVLAVSVIAATMLLYGSWRVASGVGQLVFPGVVMAEPPLPEHLPPEVRKQQLDTYTRHRNWAISHQRALAFRRLAGDLLALGAVYMIWRSHRGLLTGGGGAGVKT